jgi:two-component system, NtrC family, response regulator AtoC
MSQGRAGPEPEPELLAKETLGPAMREMVALAERAARSPINVLLAGPTGAGKELVARTIHRLSPRAACPFVALNCAGLPETLVESELFGHERGAFTGALTARTGLLEAAKGGTVFLDEIGEMPPAAQAKLLRVTETREVLPVGGLRPRPLDVRFVAATNRDLEAEVGAGRFRADLFYRLAALVITVPALAERRSEILPLARLFLERACAGRRSPPRLSAAAISFLEEHPWPGNVRELRNVVERALLFCDGDEIALAHLAGDACAAPPRLKRSRRGFTPPGGPPP